MRRATQSRQGELGEGRAPRGRTARARRLRAAARIRRGMTAAGVFAAAYMAFEAQWVRRRMADLVVPGLPQAWSGLTVLHLADVHAGAFPTNEMSLRKVIDWAECLAPDLVFLTGDVIGPRDRSRACLRLLSRLRPPLGMFAVTGNHEYGLSKGPLARPRETAGLWAEAGANLLSDTCVSLPPRDGIPLAVCGAEYLTGGYGLVEPAATRPEAYLDGPERHRSFPILLIHDQASAYPPLHALFPLAFGGHTHGGQLRFPSAEGLSPLHMEGDEYLDGVHEWGGGLLVVTRGIGTSFLPFRLLTRPEATLWRLVYTSSTRDGAWENDSGQGVADA